MGLAVATALTAALAAACSGGVGDASDVVHAEDVSGIEQVLVDKDGKALYVAEQEFGGEIKCTGGCLDIWQPLTVAKGTELSSDQELSSSLATKKRSDGKLQVTFDGYPLYTFYEDRSSGDLKGNALTDDFEGTTFTWHAMTASGPAPSSEPSESSDDDGGGGGYGY